MAVGDPRTNALVVTAAGTAIEAIARTTNGAATFSGTFNVARTYSITVNGVSLTVNWLTADEFGVNLIPHTLAITTLHDLECGAKVNLEVDMLARYVEQALSSAANYDKGLT